MAKNYYVILGVTSDSTPDEIKAAFRRRALELHPDTSGLESQPFLEIQEAYGVLSDPERRRRYDGQAQFIAPRRRPWGPAAEPLVGPRPRGEPFRPLEAASGFREASLADSFARYEIAMMLDLSTKNANELLANIGVRVRDTLLAQSAVSTLKITLHSKPHTPVSHKMDRPRISPPRLGLIR